jgi:hypothetical protein
LLGLSTNRCFYFSPIPTLRKYPLEAEEISAFVQTFPCLPARRQCIAHTPHTATFVCAMGRAESTHAARCTAASHRSEVDTQSALMAESATWQLLLARRAAARSEGRCGAKQDMDDAVCSCVTLLRCCSRAAQLFLRAKGESRKRQRCSLPSPQGRVLGCRRTVQRRGRRSLICIPLVGQARCTQR